VDTSYTVRFREVSGLNSFEIFLKSDRWLRRYCIFSGGVFYFEPPCMPVRQCCLMTSVGPISPVYAMASSSRSIRTSEVHSGRQRTCQFDNYYPTWTTGRDVRQAWLKPVVPWIQKQVFSKQYRTSVLPQCYRREGLKRMGQRRLFLGRIKNRKLKYFEHISRHNSLEKDIMLGRMPGLRRQGGQKRQWLDDLCEWTGMSLTQLIRTAEKRREPHIVFWFMQCLRPIHGYGTST